MARLERWTWRSPSRQWSWEASATSRPAAERRRALDVSRTSTGYALRLRYETELAGPCVRCLEDARLELAVDAREVDQPGAAR